MPVVQFGAFYPSVIHTDFLHKQLLADVYNTDFAQVLYTRSAHRGTNYVFMFEWENGRCTLRTLTTVIKGFLNILDKKHNLWWASLENFKIKSRLHLQHVYSSAEAFSGIWNQQSEALTVYWLQYTVPETPYGLLFLSYTHNLAILKMEGQKNLKPQNLPKFSTAVT